MALYETKASAPDSAQVSLAPLLFGQFARALRTRSRASDETTEPEAESKTRAVVSKGPIRHVDTNLVSQSNCIDCYHV